MFFSPYDKVVLTSYLSALQSGAVMPRNLEDALAKNILHDLVQLRGLAQTEAEVPPGNAKRIDLWFVPDLTKYAKAPEFTDVLAEITSEPAAIELWSDPPNEGDFHSCLTKRDLWRETLELRDKRPWMCPMLWHICAGKPDTILRKFGFESHDSPGVYRPKDPGWRVQIVVIGELPKSRSTLLLRLLGRGKVRRDALRELRSLPDDAYEKLLAQPWLARLRLDVPLDREASPEDMEFVMDIQAWYKEHNRKVVEEFRDEFRNEFMREAEVRFEARLAEERRKLEAQRVEAQRQAELEQLVHLFEHRLGQQLATDERALLASRVETLGSVHVADLVLDLNRKELASWLKTG